MPTLKKYLSPKRNEAGQTEILLRFCGGRGLIIRARSRIFIHPSIWNDRTETIKSRVLDKETNETKNKLEKLESVILEAFLTSAPSSINKEWLDTTIDKFHFPEKYEEVKPPVTLLAIVDDFIKKSQFSYYTREALEKDYRKVSRFAKEEGLTAHARAVDIRFEKEGEA